MRIDNLLQDLDEDSMRAKALIAVRDFRSCWVALGQMLTEICRGGDYQDFGYEDFEVYCARELGLKKPTVRKLMVSYNYMISYEPERVKEAVEGEQTIPEYETIHQLHHCRESDAIDDETVQKVHAKVFEGEEDEGFIRKELRELQKEAMLPGMDKAMERRKELADLLKTARGLRRKIAHSSFVPEGLRDRLEQILVEMEALD
jgi:hypothetical protein